MKIIADEQIPLLDELFADQQLLKKPGEKICNEDLRDADMLWVRTVTRVDAPLLQHTPVRFVGTATAGYDHLDVHWLNQQGIRWAYAPGANATAVAEYVLCVLAALRTNGQLSQGALRAGVIGMGQVGRVVAHYLAQIGFEVIANDPPRAQQETDFHSTPLTEWDDLDLITLHPALTQQGAYPSFHLLKDDFLHRQKPGAILLNAARGAVVDTAVLLRQTHLRLCLDVWEHEPEINLALLRRATIATPHIAAYSIAAKHRASLLLYQQAQTFFNLPNKNLNKDLHTAPDQTDMDWATRALNVFDPRAYTKMMQEFLLSEPEEIVKRFLQLRKNYAWRKSFL